MTQIKLLTVVLNYKTPEMSIDAAEAALREMEGIDGKLLIVDNDSQDGSFDKMKENAEARGWLADGRVAVVASGRNGGFGAGNNFGILAGCQSDEQPEYCYILNSDAMPDPGGVRALVDYLDTNPTCGFACSYIHGPDGEPHVTAFRFPSIWSELERSARLGLLSKLLKGSIVAMGIPEKTGPLDWSAGASMMMRRKTLEEIGLFDERFFLYFEETDLCRRAKLAGWSTDYVLESSVTHIGSVSTGMKKWSRTPRYWFDSRLYYFTKNHGAAYAALATIAHVAGGLLWRARRLVQPSLDRRDPPYFLRDLVGHAVSSMVAGVAKPKRGHAQQSLAALRPSTETE